MLLSKIFEGTQVYFLESQIEIFWFGFEIGFGVGAVVKVFISKNDFQKNRSIKKTCKK